MAPVVTLLSSLLLTILYHTMAIKLRITMEEEQPIGAVVADLAQIFRLRPEEKENRNFQLLDEKLSSNLASNRPQHHNFLTLDKSRNLIAIQRIIDRDTVCWKASECLIGIQVVMLPQKFFKLLNLEIVISDANDNPPVFPFSFITLNVSENAKRGDAINLKPYQAWDKDSGRNAAVHYSVSSNNFFEVERFNDEAGSSLLQLKLIQDLDYETHTVHQVELSATDFGKPPLTSHMTIRVEVIDQNDNAPEFNSTEYFVTLEENQPSGTIILQVQATDKDSGQNGQLSYYLVNEIPGFREPIVDGLLSIDPETGAVALLRTIDREVSEGLRVQVEARDNGHPPQSSRVRISLLIQDINDNPPIIHTNIIVTSQGNTAYISESFKNGTYVAYLRVSDADQGANGDVRVFIETIPAGGEGITEDSKYFFVSDHGFIGSCKEFDREVQNRYIIVITACDFGATSRCTNSTILVDVLDENDHDPVFSQPLYEVEVLENADVGTHVVTVKATDDDVLNQPVLMKSETGEIIRSTNGDIYYFISEQTIPFIVDAQSGKVILIGSLDREQQNEWKVTIVAEDGGSESKQASCMMKVKVVDVNDNQPLFINPTMENSTVFASIRLPGSIVKIRAMDYDDSEEYSSITLRLVNVDGAVKHGTMGPDDPYSYFILDKVSGDLTMNFSYMNMSNILGDHYLIIEARDRGSPPLSSRIGIRIEVVDSFILSEDVEEGKHAETSTTFPRDMIIIIASLIVVFIVILVVFAITKYRHMNKMKRSYDCGKAEDLNGYAVSPITASKGQVRSGDRLSCSTYNVAVGCQYASSFDHKTTKSDIEADFLEASKHHGKEHEEVLERSITQATCAQPPALSSTSPCVEKVDQINKYCSESSLRGTSLQTDMDSGKGDSEVDSFSFQWTQGVSNNDDLADQSNSLGRFCTGSCLRYGHSDSCWMPRNVYEIPCNSRRALEPIKENSPQHLQRTPDHFCDPASAKDRTQKSMYSQRTSTDISHRQTPEPTMTLSHDRY